MEGFTQREDQHFRQSSSHRNRIVESRPINALSDIRCQGCQRGAASLLIIAGSPQCRLRSGVQVRSTSSVFSFQVDGRVSEALVPYSLTFSGPPACPHRGRTCPGMEPNTQAARLGPKFCSRRVFTRAPVPVVHTCLDPLLVSGSSPNLHTDQVSQHLCVPAAPELHSNAMALGPHSIDAQSMRFICPMNRLPFFGTQGRSTVLIVWLGMFALLASCRAGHLGGRRRRSSRRSTRTAFHRSDTASDC